MDGVNSVSSCRMITGLSSCMYEKRGDCWVMQSSPRTTCLQCEHTAIPTSPLEWVSKIFASLHLHQPCRSCQIFSAIHHYISRLGVTSMQVATILTRTIAIGDRAFRCRRQRRNAQLVDMGRRGPVQAHVECSQRTTHR